MKRFSGEGVNCGALIPAFHQFLPFYPPFLSNFFLKFLTEKWDQTALISSTGK
jgi:hypothetical protein